MLSTIIKIALYFLYKTYPTKFFVLAIIHNIPPMIHQLTLKYSS